MEKTIIIDDKPVKFKSTAAVNLRYKAQFGQDFLKDIMKMKKLESVKPGDELTEEQINLIDFELFYNIAWTLAKTADKTIAEPITWLDEFEQFPIIDIVPELMDMIALNFSATKKK